MSKKKKTFEHRVGVIVLFSLGIGFLMFCMATGLLLASVFVRYIFS
jgi:hypothetical protein